MADRPLIPFNIPLNGKLITSEDPAVIGTNFQTLINLRSTDTHPKGIGGMTKINTTPITTYIKPRSGIHFRKESPSESHVVLQSYNTGETASRIIQNTTSIPSAGDFSATALYSPSTSGSTGRWSYAPNGNIAYCNGEESCIWGGAELPVSGFINYASDDTFEYDYTDIVRTSDLTDTVTVKLISSAANFYLGSTRPLGTAGVAGFKIYIDSSNYNNTAAAMGVNYWTGSAWSAVSTLVDGTRDVGETKSLNQTGTVTFASTTSTAKVSVINGVVLYWYQIIVAATVDAGVEIAQVTTGPPFQLVKDIWDGVFRSCLSFQTYNSGVWDDFTINVFEEMYDSNNSGSYAELDALDAAHGIDDNVKLLMHLDSALTDTSPNANHSPTHSGLAYDDNDFKFGTASALFSANDYVQIGDHADFDFSSGKWTIDCWVKVTSVLNEGTIYFKKTDNDNYIQIRYLATTGQIHVTIYSNTFLVWNQITTFQFTTSIWYHLEVSENDDNFYLFINGETKLVHTSFRRMPAYTGDVYIGNDDSNGSDFVGKMDEFRISNVCRHTTDFIPLDVPYEIAEDVTGYFVAGFTEPIIGVNLNIIPGKNNTEASILTASYWNGTTWTSVTATDGTAELSVPLSKSGAITWNHPGLALDFVRQINKKGSLYYYKFAYSSTFSNDVRISYVGGIPAQKSIKGFQFPTLAHNRLWLCSEKKDNKNMAICTSVHTADVHNGEDTIKVYFGDDSAITASCALYTQFGSSLYNLTVFTKKKETWALIGNSPEDWVKFQASSVIGCVAPLTMIVISLGQELASAANRNVAIWQTESSIIMFDGRSFTPIHNDIANYFDQRESESINTSKISDSVSFYDPLNHEYHWKFASGSSTTLNEEWAFDLKRLKWFKVERTATKKLQFGLTLYDTSGNAYTYGTIDTGYMERLENGTDFDGEDIVHTLQTGDFPLGEAGIDYNTEIRKIKLGTVAKTTTSSSITGTHYGEAISTAAEDTITLSPSRSGYRVAKPSASVKWPGISHSIKLSISTDDETIGFEPLFLSGFYKVIREDI